MAQPSPSRHPHAPRLLRPTLPPRRPQEYYFKTLAAPVPVNETHDENGKKKKKKKEADPFAAPKDEEKVRY